MTQKDVAIACMEQLDIYKPYIRKFKSKASIPCFFERYAGFYADQEEILWNKIKAIEAEYGCLVYAVTHEITEVGETWSMLCVSQDSDCIEESLSRADTPQHFYTFAYVWNQTAPYLSEFGDIMVHSMWGGIRRVY
jgi:hypothetical protein